ncbi:hypothetical protein SAMN05216410_2935 [Sanguibacter gelidistatuariae]|uniref:Restriction endonuclease subunit M n=1 Tax=Sanguibacter gelidistatuariae TaxID=1814289 RepID=A0A1G6SUH1_9MICO|nr:class I SAM-dependent DNA methyltransferase [Sanguibacter gelidistatuariae]SDD20512.1 hypothetical protein SAMN05216410_2935 [Sanguibacter gelidistatuariae]
MSMSDAIVIGEGWISEHYFTTEAKAQSFQAKVLERRKVWDTEAAEKRPTMRSRLAEARQQLEIDLAALGEHADAQSARTATEDVHRRLMVVLGLTSHGLHIREDGPVLHVSAPGITKGAPLAVVLARPADTIDEVLAKNGATLNEPFLLGDDGTQPASAALTSAARLVSALFVSEGAPDFVLVLAGRWAVLAERERWAEGRYLAVDVQLVCERNDASRGGEIDRMLTCLGAESVAPSADGDIWWLSILAESVKHTVGVSQALRDGVRLSIELIANEVVARRRAQGLEPLPTSESQVLAKQALRFLYRILFLLYAEASPELGVLPIGVPEYAQGYSLDRLRELVQVELASPQAQNGTHLYDSLGILFALVETGHTPKVDPSWEGRDGSAFADGLTFNSLRADLFRPVATAHIDAVRLGNSTLQEVLAHLLLSKESRGRDRGFISYAELGINQLGAVYEGLMSYTGFFADSDLYEVAKGGDASKGSWVVPMDRIEGIDPDDFVTTLDLASGARTPVVHPAGSFVFRLAGREREQSASYYTPEVLTKFTVGQALEELLDQDDQTTSAADILTMSVCEPALGSGAFAIEAVRQLAEQYLRRRQDELGERIDPDDYPRTLQEVKAYLALHNVYGVDLNATAVELAEISLWLDTMVEGLSAPWFGLHLRRGNSLIGARRATFRRDQVTSRAYLKDIPTDRPLSALALPRDDAPPDGGGVHHFLLPSLGWGSAVDAKEAKALAPEAMGRLRSWRRTIQAKPTQKQTEALVDLSGRVESLWQMALRRLDIAEQEIRRAIPVWGSEALPSGGTVQREQIEEALADVKGAYMRLRRVMDAWCALWFWPLTDTLTTFVGDDGQRERILPPSMDDWIDALRGLLGSQGQGGSGRGKNWRGGNQTLGAGSAWDELGELEALDLGLASASTVEAVLARHRWLGVCEAVAEKEGFFHWELDFASVFARGGFDLQVGNPPWVRPRSDVDALMAEGDPWWQLAVKPSEEARAAKREATLALAGMTELVVDGTVGVAVTAAFVGAAQEYPHLTGLQPDLYRCFMEQTWRHGSRQGITGLIHLESHFTDEKAGLLRSATYLRLRRHWQFINELRLFEIQHQKTFGVNVYGRVQEAPSFLHAVSLYHPDTVERSRVHDGSGLEPGIKNEQGDWDTRPHADRIVRVDDSVLREWHATLETSKVPLRRTQMVYAVNRSTAQVLEKLSHSPRVGSVGLKFSSGWHEKSDRTKGHFVSDWGSPKLWEDVILQGSHIFVGTSFYKSPNSTMKNKDDWASVDVESLASNAVPITIYKPSGKEYDYDCAYTEWGDEEGPKPARDYYRVAWRAMAANTGERTLAPAIIPPGATHVHGVASLGSPWLSSSDLILVAAFLGSLVHDFSIRVAPKSTISGGSISRLPFSRSGFETQIVFRALRLNVLSDTFSDLWNETHVPSSEEFFWTGGIPYIGRPELGDVTDLWTSTSPLRRAADRRQALLEIDVLVALSLNLTADELCTIYRTQFPVLYGYDRNTYFYDANGRLVPNEVLTVWRKKCDSITEVERKAVHPGSDVEYTYELPFVTLDREADMRQAYAHFEMLLKDQL